jgi:hypothetical protein
MSNKRDFMSGYSARGLALLPRCDAPKRVSGVTFRADRTQVAELDFGRAIRLRRPAPTRVSDHFGHIDNSAQTGRVNLLRCRFASARPSLRR